MRSTGNFTAGVTDKLHIHLNLRRLRSLAGMFLAAVVVPATAQTAPGVVNDPVAVGTAGYGVVEAGDGNYYAMSLRKPSTCAGNTTMTCSFIYQIIGKTLTNYHSFQPASSANPAPVNLDGLEPTALIVGTDGNLYGACMIGGPRGFGTIFKIVQGGTLSVLASFGINAAGTALDPGNQPLSLIQGADGNLYFVNVGGVYSINLTSGALSTVATIPVNGANQTDPDGYNASSIMQASDGNFYLTVELTPGIYTGGAGANAGGIIQVTPGGTINVVHTFAVDGSEGLDPFSPLVQGPDGYLYGATRDSNVSTGNGIAFKVQPNGNGTFVSLGPLPGQDSGPPSNALTVGSDGNLYGTSQLGGATTAARCTPLGCGILFRMTPSGAFTTMYAFQGGSPASPNTTASTPVDGAFPNSPVIQTDSGEFLGSSIGFGINSPVFFDVDLGATVPPPVKLTVTPAIAAIKTPVSVTWTVSNAFSDTAQNCGAVVQGGLSGVGAWSGRQTGSLANGIYSGSKTLTPTQSGNYTLGLICGGNQAGFAELQVSAGFSIATPAFPGAQVNVDYSGAIQATGGTQFYHWTITNIPPGLTDAGGGSLTGKPTQFGDYTLPVTVTDSSTPPQQITGTVTLKVISGLKIQNKSLVKATIGSNYKQQFVALYGQPPYKWSISAGTLPNGLTLDPVSGLLSGTPTATGNSPITVQVQDSEPTPDMVTLSLTLKVVPSVQIAGVEFTQAIQQYQNLDDLQSSISTNGEPPVPIVSGKWAVMRVYFTSLKDSTDITLTATGDAVGVKPFTLSPNCETVDQRNKVDPCRSMDFYFMAPTGPWTTTLTLEDSNNNQLEQETFNIVSRNTSSIFLKGVSVCGVVNQPTSCGDPSVLLNILDFSNKILPTNSVTAGTTTRKVQKNFANYPTDIKWLEALVTGMNTYLYTGADASSDASSNTRTDYAGIYQHVYSDTGIGWLGGHALIIADSATRQGVTATQQVLAHETGHTLNIPHTGTSDPPGSLQPSCWGPGSVSAGEPNSWLWATNRLQSSAGFEEGFDVEQQTIVDGFNDFDVMSYCMPRWISPLNYKQMFAELNGGSVTSPNVKGAPRKAVAHPKPAVTFAPGSYWTVSGSIPSTGFVLDPIFTETTTGTSDPGTGTYSIQVQGAAGQVLFTRKFTPIVPQTDTTGTDFQTDPIFSETIPAITGATAIAVVDPTGASLKTVNFAGTAPTVTITSPGAGFAGTAQQSLSWMVTSPTATSFTSRIFYSTDAGVTWQQVLDTTDTSAVIDFDTLPGAAAALIRIDASDGVNTGSAKSAAFSVPKKLPTAVVINNPVNGSTFPAANPVLLSGGAYDPDDGFLSGKALAWTDSAQGSLGSGSPLPVTLKPGSHTITLIATDSDGNALTATTEVTLGGAAPAVTLTTTQNSACYSATINAAPGAQGAGLTAANYSLNGGNTYTAIPLTSLPFTLPLNGTGTVNVVAFATDASGQVSSQSAAVNLGTGCASTVKASAGSGQSAVVGTAFATALTTLVVDLNGNPVSGTTVSYAAPASGASAALSAATATTNASGIATVTATANSTAGGYNVTASATNGTSTATFALTNSDFQIAAGTAALTVLRGATGNDTITLTALGGFNGTVTFGCSGLPAGATCTFAPATVTPTVATASTTMTIAALQTASLRWPVGGGSIVACALLACIIRRRKYFHPLAIIVSVVALISLTACGSSPHKQPTTASITVTASAGSVQRTTTVTLQIQ
jgi:uncharacterized repeat protein (TIGR03803 family)